MTTYRKMELDHCLTQLMKINWKWIKDSKKKLTTVKHLVYYIGKNLLYISRGNNIFDMTQTPVTKGKIKKAK